MTLNLHGRVALVTGASRGIGAATAVALARHGAHVVLTARTVGGLEEVDDAIQRGGGHATLAPLDLTEFDKIDALASALHARFGKLDILVANAAILGELTPLVHGEPALFERTLATNLTANWRLIRAFDPLLRRAPAATAIFVTSSAATRAASYWGLYAVSKAALSMLADTYRLETEGTSIDVRQFNPGATRTKMRAQAMPGENPATLPTPEDAANALLALLS